MLLFLMLSILLIAILLILNSSKFSENQINTQSISLKASMICFFLSIFFWIFFDRSNIKYQFIMKNFFFNDEFSQSLIGHIAFGIDGISLFFVILSTFIIPLCLLTSYKEKFLKVVDYCLYFLVLEVFLILSFTALDIISFFIFFESILIPMFFIIGI